MVSWEEKGTVIFFPPKCSFAKPDEDFQILAQVSFFIQICVDELTCPVVPSPQGSRGVQHQLQRAFRKLKPAQNCVLVPKAEPQTLIWKILTLLCYLRASKSSGHLGWGLKSPQTPGLRLRVCIASRNGWQTFQEPPGQGLG